MDIARGLLDRGDGQLPAPKGFSLDESLMLSWMPMRRRRSSAEVPGT